MLLVMTDNTLKRKLQGVLDRTNEFLGYSIDHVGGIRDDVIGDLRDLYDDLDRVRREVNEVLTASDAVTEAYKQARKRLVSAEITNDHDAQAEMYQEAERYLRLKTSFEERERYLRRRRDDLERERLRMERILSQSTNTMGKLRLAVEILKNKLDSVNSLRSPDGMHNVVLGLQFAERENKRLAREIHDGPIQQFAASALSFEYLERVVARGDKDAINEEMARIKDQLQEALSDFRGFLLRLQPLGLEKGLGRAITRLADSYNERHGINFVLDGTQLEDSFSMVLRQNVFRVIQEATSNAIRHGGAKNITVHYEYTKDYLTLSIEDDGKGFEVDKGLTLAAERGSFGLSNMSERIHFVNGKMDIDSAPGEGTRINIKVPIGGEDEE